MKIILTGHLGFIGSATKKLLEEKGHEVIGFDIMEHNDIRDKKFFEECIKEISPDRILHLAAIARFADSDRDPQLAFETNVLGTKNVAEVAAKYHIPIVYASTGSVYMPIEKTPPITEDFPVSGNSHYACTKLLGELYIKRQQNPYIILRYAHIYGKEKRGHGIVGAFVERIQRGITPTLYGGSQSNDFCYIDDIARANVLALEATWDKYYQTYNIGSGEELKASEVSRIICEKMGFTTPVEIGNTRTVDPIRFVYGTSKAERMLNFKSEYNFEQGITKMLSEINDTSIS
jgi:UDP-glucose 4-epimerase